MPSGAPEVGSGLDLAGRRRRSAAGLTAVAAPAARAALPGVLFATSVLGAVALLVSRARHLWFFGDDWDFLLQRGVTGRPELGLFEPHNGHWSTLPILVFRLLFSLFGARHYLPYALVVIVAHAAVAVLLWSLLRRSGIRPWIAAAVGAVVAVMGAGAENTLWDFQIGFVGSVAFGLAALRLMPATPSLGRRDGLVCLALVASLMCSGQGLVMLATVCTFALVARGPRPAVLTGALGAGVYLVWYAAAGHRGAETGGITLSTLGGVPAYLWTGLANVWGALTGIPGAGLLILVGSAVLLVRDAPLARTTLALAASGLAGSVCMFVLAALVRVQYGVDQALSGRYVYIAAVLSAPAVAAGAQRLLGDREAVSHVARGACLALFVLVAVSGVNAVVQFEADRQRLVDGLPQRLVGAWQLVERGAPLLLSYPESQYEPNVTTERLARLGRLHQLPELGANEQGILDAAGALQVEVGPRHHAFASADRFTGAGILVARQELHGGCVTGTTQLPNAYVDVPVAGAATAFTLRTSAAHVFTQLQRGGRTSAVVIWPATPQAEQFVAATSRGSVLRVIFPQSTTFTLCANT